MFELLNPLLDWVLCKILTATTSYRVENNADVRIMLLVGEIMPKVFRGETSMLEHFRTSGLLDEYYATGFGTQQSGMWLSGMVKQLTDRHPHLRLFEIGKSAPFAPWWVDLTVRARCWYRWCHQIYP